MGEINAPKQIQQITLRLDHVKPKAGADHKPQIEILEFVVFVIVKSIHKQALCQIVVVLNPAANCSCSI